MKSKAQKTIIPKDEALDALYKINSRVNNPNSNDEVIKKRLNGTTMGWGLDMVFSCFNKRSLMA